MQPLTYKTYTLAHNLHLILIEIFFALTKEIRNFYAVQFLLLVLFLPPDETHIVFQQLQLHLPTELLSCTLHMYCMQSHLILKISIQTKAPQT